MSRCRDSDTGSGFAFTALSLIFKKKFSFFASLSLLNDNSDYADFFFFAFGGLCILLQFFLSRLVFHPALPPHADR